jgi:hypothetical protein
MQVAVNRMGRRYPAACAGGKPKSAQGWPGFFPRVNGEGVFLSGDDENEADHEHLNLQVCAHDGAQGAP